MTLDAPDATIMMGKSSRAGPGDPVAVDPRWPHGLRAGWMSAGFLVQSRHGLGLKEARGRQLRPQGGIAVRNISRGFRRNRRNIDRSPRITAKEFIKKVSRKKTPVGHSIIKYLPRLFLHVIPSPSGHLSRAVAGVVIVPSSGSDMRLLSPSSHPPPSRTDFLSRVL